MDCRLSLGLVAVVGVVVSAIWFVVAGFFVGGLLLYLPVLFVSLGCGLLAARMVSVLKLEKCNAKLEMFRERRRAECESDWLFESDLDLKLDEVELIEQWIDVYLR